MLYYRIFRALVGFVLALSLAACGGGGGGGSTGGGAGHAGGWLVATHIDAAGHPSINVYHADNASAPVYSIPGGVITDSVKGLGLMYGVTHDLLSLDELGLITSGAQRVTLVPPSTGHAYSIFAADQMSAGALPSNRLLVTDTTQVFDPATNTNKTLIALLSVATDGTDLRTLKSGCTQLEGGFNNGNKFSATGVLFSCNTGSGFTLWFSDGLAAATELPGTLNCIPKATDGTFALYIDTVNRLMSRRTDGTGNAVQLSPDANPMVDTLLAFVNSTALMVTRSSSNTYDTWTVPFGSGGLFAHPVLDRAASTRLGTPAVTPDRSHFVVIYGGDPAVAALVPVDASDPSFVNLTPPGQSAYSVSLFADGKALVQHAGGFQVVTGSSTGAPTTGATLDAQTLDRFWGTLGGWAVFQDYLAPYSLKAAREDGALSTVLAAKGDLAVQPRLLPSGRILFVDDTHIPWVATPDLSTKVQLDTDAVTGLRFAGGDDTREFYVLEHTSQPPYHIDTVVFHIDTGKAEKFLGGPTVLEDWGWFLP